MSGGQHQPGKLETNQSTAMPQVKSEGLSFHIYKDPITKSPTEAPHSEKCTRLC